MNHIKLVKPTTLLEEEYRDFCKDWEEAGERIAPSVMRKGSMEFEQWVKQLNDAEAGIGLPEGHVPSSTRWLVDDDDRILGASHIRHDLTGRLLETEGHIGGGIRPSERQKGYATMILELSLKELSKLGVKRALVTCNEDNLASAKVIKRNGGMEGLPFTEEHGNVVRRFWINLNPNQL
ncbi:GNAT family N-acetyltransferase [Alkalibacillus aidingensis]|uniref:GNAT family N-acetyltransferase n=1 Tax=Alkalibacillus aidingensis TaxID=2747607 RepID=UPI002948BEA6|nr:GNAT family N-acetyltransferase [Alkalibacillus aidingensis]